MVNQSRTRENCTSTYYLVINELEHEHSCNHTPVKKEAFAGCPRGPPHAPHPPTHPEVTLHRKGWRPAKGTREKKQPKADSR